MARSILTDAERLAWERFPSDPDPDAIGIYFTLADARSTFCAGCRHPRRG